MKTAILLLLELAVLGISYCFFSLLEMRLFFDEFKQFHKLKVISIVIFVIGVLIHTLGDIFNYGAAFSMQLETVGHVIIMVGALILIRQSLNLRKVAEEL